MKKLISLVLALAMIMMVGAVYAEGEDTANAATSTWRGTADGSVSISGLKAGDSVNFYQVFEYSDDARTTGGWVLKSPFSLTPDQVNQILGLEDYAATGSKAALAGIDKTLAGTIANQVTNTATVVNAIASGTTSATATATVNPGLYVALITPADPTNVYNPVFVGSDYYTNDSGVWALTADMSYDPASLAKVETITLTKEIDGDSDIKYDVNIGDDVPFTISTFVPAYSTAYQNRVYVITDTLDDGLVVKEGTTPVVSITGITADSGDYTVAVAADRKSFTVTLTDAGLDKVAATGTAKAITVTYSATVTTLDGDVNITEKDNTATVKFSNNPDDETSYSLLEDKTRTYSFSLDATLLGNSEWENSEVVKVGLNKDGTEITQTTLSNGATAGVLTGAKFGLYTNQECTTAYSNGVTGADYENIVSDSKGKLNISGLDAGTYYLKEISAPDGYIKSDSTYKIVITAHYQNIEGGSYTNDEGILVKYDAYKVLQDYNVAVSEIPATGSETALSTTNFTITNSGEDQNKTTTAAAEEANKAAKLRNTQGVELPSTGGIGTTIFYIVGGLLLVGAAIVLISRRKAND